MTNALDQRLEREIIDLHAFFAQWYNGEISKDDRTFARFADVMAPDFCIITPCGSVVERDALLASVYNGHGEDRSGDGPFEIDIRNIRPRIIEEGRALVMYEEWQRTGEKPWRGRVSSAWFTEAGEAPNGVVWRHLHETWLPAEK